MKIKGSVGLVTGADRGLGRVFARDLVRRGDPWRPTPDR
jgi:NAD(P)-dependent dehydrogenase (short-subunit alcohol dehydrogenase family)